MSSNHATTAGESDLPPRLSRAQEIAATLEAEIRDQDWPVGWRVGLRTEMMKRFEASPTAINEALGILRDRQLIEVRRGPGGGVFVASRPPHVRLGVVHLWFNHTNVSPAWMFELRVRVENRAVPRVLARITDADIERLEDLLRIIAGTDDPEAYLEAAFGFHDVLVRVAGDDLLSEMHRMLLTVLRVSRARATFSPDVEVHRPRSVMIHRELIDALRTGDEVRFERFIAAHFQTMMRTGMDIGSDEAVAVPVWSNLPAGSSRDS